MPNYDIIPLAVDLLEYTIQRVKTKEPEYRKTTALVQENGQLVERELYAKIKDDGKPHFPKSQTFHLCARLEDCAIDILEKCISADGRYFETDFEERLKDLDAVLVACDTMLQYINLSFKKKYITGDQCHYWAELVRPVRQKAFSWRRNDGNRAAALREAKSAQELAKMSQMARQIAEAIHKSPLNGYTGHEPLYWGVTCLFSFLPEHEQHQQRLELELQRQPEQQQLFQHQRVPSRSDGKARPIRPKAESSAIHHIKGGHIPSWSIQDKHIALMRGTRLDRALRCWSCLLRAPERRTMRGRPAKTQTGGRPFWIIIFLIYAPLRCFTRHTLRHAGANAPELPPHTMRCICWRTSSTLCIS